MSLLNILKITGILLSAIVSAGKIASSLKAYACKMQPLLFWSCALSEDNNQVYAQLTLIGFGRCQPVIEFLDDLDNVKLALGGESINVKGFFRQRVNMIGWANYSRLRGQIVNDPDLSAFIRLSIKRQSFDVFIGVGQSQSWWKRVQHLAECDYLKNRHKDDYWKSPFNLKKDDYWKSPFSS